jgi:YidC/Oxa1 family membrane protein insertase
MDRKTVIAVVLAVVVIIGSMLVNNLIASKKKPASLPPEKPPAAVTEQPLEKPAPQAGQQAQPVQPPGGQQPSGQQPAQAAAPAAGAAAQASGPVQSVGQPEISEQTVTLDTDVYHVTFSNRGGVATSIQLKQFKDEDGSPVQMVLSKNTGRYPFSLRFGDVSGEPVNALFQVEKSSTGESVSFYRTFAAGSGAPFLLRKTYVFHPHDYMIELRISIENSVNEYPNLGSSNFAYTLGYGPQIGPPFQKLDRYNEYRTYMYYAEGKKKDVRIPRDGLSTLQNRVDWAGIAGKYFEVIAIPDATHYVVSYENKPLEGLQDRSSIYFSRPEIKSAKQEDVFRFYIGPKKKDILASYNRADKNGFKLSGLNLDKSIPEQPLIGWLANILGFFLELFYRLIPNYGVAILLLTLLIKLLFWPLTAKSYQSTAKMQALQPKMKELQAKFKNNPQKLNQEMAALYKKEGVSPLGGCLPLLLQLPIFFALYSLLNTHFDLRGAPFIHGWINDLSAPESILTFKTVNLLFWKIDALRVLPFLMLGTTFLQSKVSQTSAPTDKNMALMTYAMPIVFFFILYNMPSGLVLYWTAQNVLGIVQQLITNSQRKKKQALEATREVAVVKKRK